MAIETNTNSGSDLATILRQILSNGQMQNQSQIYGGFSWATLDAQAAVARETQRRVELDLARNAPYYEASADALGELKAFEENPREAILSNPSYQFAVEQADRSLAARQAADGGLYSGKTLKGAAQYATDLANQYYGDEWMRKFQRAYSGSPHGWTPQGGAADYPDLSTMQSKYAGMFADGGSPGDGRRDLVWIVNPDGSIRTEEDTAYKYQDQWNQKNSGISTTEATAKMWADEYRAAQQGYDTGTYGQIPDYYNWANGQWAASSPYYSQTNTPGVVATAPTSDENGDIARDPEHGAVPLGGDGNKTDIYGRPKR